MKEIGYLGIVVVFITVLSGYLLFYQKQMLSQSINSTLNRSATTCTSACMSGQRVSNFLISSVNRDNVTGLFYIMYPVAYLQGTPKTIHVGDTVGYSCDGTLAKLVNISNGIAVFQWNTTKSRYGCPI